MIESIKPMVSPGVEAALTGETPTSSKDFIEAAMDYVQNDGGHAVFTREELEHESFDVREVVDFGQGRIEVHDEAAVLRMVEGGSPPIWAKALAPVSPEEAALAVIEPPPAQDSAHSIPPNPSAGNGITTHREPCTADSLSGRH